MIPKQPLSAVVAYFSGTGGTALAADYCVRHLTAKGVTVQAVEIPFDRGPSREALEAAELLLVLSPVYAFRLASPVERWLKQLPNGGGTTAAVISVSGGGEMPPNTACRSSAKRLLRRKNYRVSYEKMLVMPSNFAAATPEPAALALLKVLPDKTAAMIDDLLAGREQLTRPLLLDRLAAQLGRAEHLGGRLFGAGIRVSAACTQCGLCVARCPSGNLRLENGRIRSGFKCFFCLKCFYSCPRHALSPRIGQSIIIKDFSIQRLREAAQNSGRPEVALNNPAWQGLIKYLNE